jgi:hypothetical protein
MQVSPLALHGLLALVRREAELSISRVRLAKQVFCGLYGVLPASW